MIGSVRIYGGTIDTNAHTSVPTWSLAIWRSNNACDPQREKVQRLTERLSDGKKVIELFRSVSSMRRIVLIIRHSERISFHNVPMHQWDSAGITEHGFAAAKDLGRALVRQAEALQWNVHSWGQMRCVQTASAIAGGITEEGAVATPIGNLNIKGPIANESAYKEFITTGRWQEMLSLWQQSGDTGGSLVPIDVYSPMVFGEILVSGICPPNRVSLIATHDLHILPLARYALGTAVNPPDYLDGIVLGEQGGEVKIGFGDLIRSTSTSKLMHPT